MIAVICCWFLYDSQISALFVAYILYILIITTIKKKTDAFKLIITYIT